MLSRSLCCSSYVGFHVSLPLQLCRKPCLTCRRLLLLILLLLFLLFILTPFLVLPWLHVTCNSCSGFMSYVVTSHVPTWTGEKISVYLVDCVFHNCQWCTVLSQGCSHKQRSLSPCDPWVDCLTLYCYWCTFITTAYSSRVSSCLWRPAFMWLWWAIPNELMSVASFKQLLLWGSSERGIHYF